jgi:hypothetical protein
MQQFLQCGNMRLSSLPYIEFTPFFQQQDSKGEFMKLAHTSALLLGGLAIAASTSALAGVDIGINLGPPVVVAPAPVYVAPPPPV